MRYILNLLLLIVTFSNSFSQVHVRGYYRKNGTYVQPYYRSSPDGNPYNNYSYPGNINPYTGKVAPGNPTTYLNNYYNKKSTTNNSNSGSSNEAAYNYARQQTYRLGQRTYSYFSYSLYTANYYQVAISYPRYSSYEINDKYGYTVGYAISKGSRKYILYDTTISKVGYVKLSNKGYYQVFDSNKNKLYSNRPRGQFIRKALGVILIAGALIFLVEQ